MRSKPESGKRMLRMLLLMYLGSQELYGWMFRYVNLDPSRKLINLSSRKPTAQNLREALMSIYQAVTSSLPQSECGADFRLVLSTCWRSRP